MVKGGLISPAVCFEGIWKLSGQIPIEKKKKEQQACKSVYSHTWTYIRMKMLTLQGGMAKPPL